MWTINSSQNLINKLVSPDIRAFNIYDEIRLLSGANDDPEDKRIFAFTLCEDCTKRSKKCSVCKLNNSQGSLQQMQELNLLRENFEIVPNGLDPDGNNKFFVQVNYPVLGNVSELYAERADRLFEQ